MCCCCLLLYELRPRAMSQSRGFSPVLPLPWLGCSQWRGWELWKWHSGSRIQALAPGATASESQTDVSSFSSSREGDSNGLGTGQALSAAGTENEMKSFIFIAPPPCCGFGICSYLLIVVLGGMNHLFRAGGRKSLCIPTLPLPCFGLYSFCRQKSASFKLLAQAASMCTIPVCS